MDSQCDVDIAKYILRERLLDAMREMSLEELQQLDWFASNKFKEDDDE